MTTRQQTHDPGCLAKVPDFDWRDCTCMAPALVCFECGSNGSDVRAIPPFMSLPLCKPCRQTIQCTG